MWRALFRSATGAAVAAMLSGCLSTEPLLQNPAWIRADPCVTVENPVFLPQGPQTYRALWEMVLDIMSDYFEIKYAYFYDGQIITFTRTAPGLEQPFKPGSPDFDQRLYATLQSVRHHAEVRIQPVNDGGFTVEVRVFKELEDLPRPTSSVGAAAFRSDPTVERYQEVIDTSYLISHWIPIGRDTPLEQVILQRISRWDQKAKCPPRSF
jgi:hypothetical protein